MAIPDSLSKATEPAGVGCIVVGGGDEQLYYLFIGGPADGKRLALPHLMDRYRYPVEQRSEHGGFSHLSYALYRPEKFRGGSKTYVVYAEDSLTIEDLITMLIDGYH